MTIGHEIGAPAPLIREIKPEEIQNLKQRFAGRSKPSKPSPPKEMSTETSIGNAKQLEEQVIAQGEAVRKLKESKAEKEVIKGAVDQLLELKKQLALAQGKDPKEVIGGGSKKKGKKK